MAQPSLYQQVLDYANRANPYPLYTQLRQTPVLREADGTYVVGGFLDTLWIAAAFVVGIAAWQRPPAVASIQLKAGRLVLAEELFELLAASRERQMAQFFAVGFK